MKNNTIFVGGLSGSGKTHWLLHSRHYWQTQKIACGFFKPFETGASEKNAQDKASDGELYLKQEKHTIGGLSAINPYSCQQSFPLAFASQSEGFKISLEKLEEKYLQAKTNKNLLLVELLEGVCHPLNKEIYLLEWLKKKTNKIIWLMTLDSNKFLWNQLELKTLSDAGFQTFIILNNYKKNLDTEWIKYCWLESEKKKNCTVIGLLPLLSSALQNESLNKITVIWDKLKPRLLN